MEGKPEYPIDHEWADGPEWARALISRDESAWSALYIRLCDETGAFYYQASSFSQSIGDPAHTTEDLLSDFIEELHKTPDKYFKKAASGEHDKFLPRVYLSFYNWCITMYSKITGRPRSRNDSSESVEKPSKRPRFFARRVDCYDPQSGLNPTQAMDNIGSIEEQIENRPENVLERQSASSTPKAARLWAESWGLIRECDALKPKQGSARSAPLLAAILLNERADLAERAMKVKAPMEYVNSISSWGPEEGRLTFKDPGQASLDQAWGILGGIIAENGVADGYTRARTVGASRAAWDQWVKRAREKVILSVKPPYDPLVLFSHWPMIRKSEDKKE